MLLWVSIAAGFQEGRASVEKDADSFVRSKELEMMKKMAATFHERFQVDERATSEKARQLLQSEFR